MHERDASDDDAGLGGAQHIRPQGPDVAAIVRTVIILVDNDANGAGERAARAAAERWRAEGRRVWIAMPAAVGQDFNDLLLGRSASEIAETRNVA